MSSITTDLGSWAALVGILLPALVALLQRDHWGSTVNGVVFAAACFVAAVVYVWLKQGFTWGHWAAAFYAIAAWALATYHLYWKPSQIAAKLRAVPPASRASPRGSVRRAR